jgi:hypothetical protein
MDYPCTFINAQTASGDALNVTVRVEDEYHLIDEAALIQAIRDHLAADTDIATVTAARYDVSVTPL